MRVDKRERRRGEMKREIPKEKWEEKRARARERLQHLVLVLLQEHLELADIDAQVTVNELIWDELNGMT